jgi:alkaline phosphatase D
MGRAQEDWLDQGLRNSARWNLIAQQVFVMPLYVAGADGTRQLRPGPDGWSGYPEARSRLVQSIARNRLSNVVIATGDAHINAIGTVPMRDDAPDGPAAAVEFLATSITSGGDGSAGELPRYKTLRAASPNVALLNDQRGYQMFDITAREWRTAVRVLDQVQAPNGAISTLARFAVEPEKPELHRL